MCLALALFVGLAAAPSKGPPHWTIHTYKLVIDVYASCPSFCDPPILSRLRTGTAFGWGLNPGLPHGGQNTYLQATSAL